MFIPTISKMLLSNPKKYPKKLKVILFCIYMCTVNAFVIWMAIATFNRGFENLQDLTHVTGEMKRYRIIKSKYSTRYKTSYKNVLVIRIVGFDDEFGFERDNENYPELTNIVNSTQSPYFDIYYDESRHRIEQNVTLHIFDMTINGKKYVSISEIKKSEFRATIICSAIALLLFLFTYWGSKRIIQRGLII